MKQTIQVFLILSAATSLVFFALYCWPTIYRYERTRYASGGEVPARINRVNGTTDLLTTEGWVWQRKHPAANPTETKTGYQSYFPSEGEPSQSDNPTWEDRFAIGASLFWIVALTVSGLAALQNK